MICPICKRPLTEYLHGSRTLEKFRKCFEPKSHSFDIFDDGSFSANFVLSELEEICFVIIEGNVCDVFINNGYTLTLKNVTPENVVKHFESISKLKAFL